MTRLNLVIDTSTRTALAGLVREGRVVQSVTLDETRRHAKDLAASVSSMLLAESATPKDVASVVVSRGPGSFTGLRVGLASAKAFAYAVGCPLVAVPTFHAVAESLPEGIEQAEIVSDALNGLIYRQRFERAGVWKAQDALEIVAITDWNWQPVDAVVTPQAFVLPIPRECPVIPATLAGLWAAAKHTTPLTREEMFDIEPLYLRGSSAEEKRKALNRP